MRVLHIDFESSSPEDLIAVGVHKYAQNPYTHVYCMSYRFDDESIKRWRYFEPFPAEVANHVAAGGVVVAHNAAFERTMWNVTLRRPNIARGTPAITLPTLHASQMICTLARANALALPAGLDYVAQVMGVENRKDAVGSKLMRKWAAPASVIKDETGHVAYTWHSDLEELERICAYCDQDVVVETDIDRVVLQHNARERKVWELDQAINDRGVRLDLVLCRSAIEVVEIAQERLHARLREITNGQVEDGNKVQQIAKWINSRGIPCASIAKGVQDELIHAADIIDQSVTEAIRIRQQIGKGTPTTKYQTMVDCAGEGDKARGQLHYHGTTTGRWAGRLIQFQNLPGVDEDRDLANVMACVQILGSGLTPSEMCDALFMITGTILPVLSKSLRHMLIASPGCRFVGGDLSNIEGCVAAWIADENWKVTAYREYQAKRGPDLYKVAYSRAFDTPIEAIVKSQRQIGKVMELALGYQGSIGAFMSMAKIHGIKPGDMVGPIRAATDPEVWEKTKDRMKYAGSRTYGLTVDEWTALKVTVELWRASHPKISAAWWELQEAAIKAVADGLREEEDAAREKRQPVPQPVEVLDGKCAYVYARQVLWCRLPSGRYLAYHRPYVKRSYEYEMQLVGEKTITEWVAEEDIGSYILKGWVKTDREPRSRHSVVYEGYDNTHKKWTTFQLYGGLQFENIVQAVARDVMVEGMFLAEAAGYLIVLTVHDELLTDTPLGHGSAADLQRIMSIVPDWAPGLPLAAKCWEDERYAK